MSNNNNKAKLQALISKIISETLVLKRHGDKLVVTSDLETRSDQSKETFKNKNALSAAKFAWNRDLNSWTIDPSRLDHAQLTLAKINKVGKFVEKIEELPEFIASQDNVTRGDEISKRIEGFINHLTTELDEKAASDEIRKFLEFQSKLRKRSANNALLIYIQRPSATHVEGFRVWQEKFGRQVKKGAKAIVIFAPMGGTKKKEEDEEIDDSKLDDSVKRKQISGFRPVNVFDVADTEAISGKEHLYVKEPEWHSSNTPDENANKLYDYSSKLVGELGINLERSAAQGGEMGSASGDHINITSNVEGVNKAATLIHEIAHELLHFRKSSIFYVDDPTITRQDKEIQAETASYLVLRHYDLPAQHHSTYLALWKTSKDSLQRNLSHIKKAADFIISKIDEIAGEETPQISSDTNKDA